MNPENLKDTVGTLEYCVKTNINIPKEQLSYEEKLTKTDLKETIETYTLEELKEISKTIASLTKVNEEHPAVQTNTKQVLKK